MKRLTTNDPQGNVETAHNLFYAKDTEVWVRGGGAAPDYADITLYDFIRQIVQSLGPMSIDTSVPDEELGEELCELLFDGTGTIEGLVATLYTAAWAFADLRNRLAAYEDTGLEPEEVDQIRRAAQTMMFPTVADFVRYAIQNFEDLEKYRKAEAEGHLFMTPCKEGDTVWTIWDDEVRENTVLGVTVDRYGLHILAQYNQGGAIRDYNFDRIGKTVFLTREAAEAALEAREGA